MTTVNDVADCFGDLAKAVKPAIISLRGLVKAVKIYNRHRRHYRMTHGKHGLKRPARKS